jgi:predicted PurR-regulated permease PerM
MKKIFLFLVCALMVSGVMAQNPSQSSTQQTDEMKDVKQQVVKLKGSNAVLIKKIEDLKSVENKNFETLNKLISDNAVQIKIASDSLYESASSHQLFKEWTNKRFHEARSLLIALFVILLILIGVIIYLYLGNTKKIQLLKKHIENSEASHSNSFKELSDSIASVKNELKSDISNLQRSINKQ